MSDAPEILADIEGSVGHLTLNRPAAINALSLSMVRLIAAALEGWQHDPAVRCVVIGGAGPRGFCAGGDIRAVWDAVRAGEDLPAVFWAEEYRLVLRIAQYPKPVVALMDGIVMGGGVGLSAHAAHRVVTERTTIAMPETGIGFIPDVGGTLLLGRMPGGLGLHLALTAGRCTGADALACGLADLCIAAGRLGEIIAALQGADTHGRVRAALAPLVHTPPPGPLEAARPWIAAAYAGDDVGAIVAALQARPEPLAAEAATAILRNAPLPLCVTLRALREAPGLGGLAAVLEREYRLALAATWAPDFVEGVRAQVVDKDRTPGWSPPLLADVRPSMVDAWFAPGGADLMLQ